MQTKYDLIVIGSGSVGSAAGYYSAKAGLKVLMLDEFIPPHKLGSHHGETRIMRQAYGEGDAYVPLLLRAQSLWIALKEYAARTQGPSIFEQTGVLNAGPRNAEFVNQSILSAKKYGIKIELQNRDEIKTRWPEIKLPSNYMGVYEPNAGVLFSENIIRSYLELSLQLGAKQCFECRVTDIKSNSEGVKVQTSKGDFYASKILLSAGTFVKDIVNHLPIIPVRRVFAWHQADGRFSHLNNFPAFTIEDEKGEAFYGFPSVDNALKIGKHLDWEIINSREELVPFGYKTSDGSALLKFLKHYLPGVGGCLIGKACSYDMTADGHFIIDSLDDTQNIMVITGLSGHGFKFSSVLGEIASLFAKGEAIPYDLSLFSLKRFIK